jgi:hypothetical protein
MKIWELVPTGLATAVRLLGWLPVGKKVVLTIVETPNKSQHGRRESGTIVAVDGTTTAVVELVDKTTIKVRTRHVGYDLFYLAIGPIAVYLSKAPNDQTFAGAMLKLSGNGQRGHLPPRLPAS